MYERKYDKQKLEEYMKFLFQVSQFSHHCAYDKTQNTCLGHLYTLSTYGGQDLLQNERGVTCSHLWYSLLSRSHHEHESFAWHEKP